MLLPSSRTETLHEEDTIFARESSYLSSPDASLRPTVKWPSLRPVAVPPTHLDSRRRSLPVSDTVRLHESESQYCTVGKHTSSLGPSRTSVHSHGSHILDRTCCKPPPVRERAMSPLLSPRITARNDNLTLPNCKCQHRRKRTQADPHSHGLFFLRLPLPQLCSVPPHMIIPLEHTSA